jgi:hypothetical protein
MAGVRLQSGSRLSRVTAQGFSEEQRNVRSASINGWGQDSKACVVAAVFSYYARACNVTD